MAYEIGGVSLEEFRTHLTINKESLDEDITVQSDLFFRVSEAYAFACSRRDAAKEQVKQVDAKMDLEIRQDAVDNGVKLTEGKITNLVAASVEHLEAASEHLDFIEEVNIFGSLKEAFSQRSYMLRELVELYCVGYYSDPDYVRNKAEMRENARRDRLDDSVRKKKKRKDK
jgi:hypothetical protein